MHQLNIAITVNPALKLKFYRLFILSRIGNRKKKKRQFKEELVVQTESKPIVAPISNTSSLVSVSDPIVLVLADTRPKPKIQSRVVKPTLTLMKLTRKQSHFRVLLRLLVLKEHGTKSGSRVPFWPFQFVFPPGLRTFKMLRDEERSTNRSVKEDEILAEWNVKFRKVDQSLSGNLKEHFPNCAEHGFVTSEPGGFFLMDEYSRHAEKIYRFQPRSDDVWVVTFPRCGTTWTQELVWMIMNDCDKIRAKAPLMVRSPFLELPYMLPFDATSPEIRNMMVTLETIEEMPSPRIIKSHLPFFLLHPKLLDTCKVVYVARNPKDVIVSCFYHHRLFDFHYFDGDVEKFAQYFMDGEVMFSPFFPHILDAWSKRHLPNMLFLFYEDLKKDLRGEIEKIAKFLGKSLAEEQLEDLREHLRFDNFAKNESVNMEPAKQFGRFNPDGHFVRKGKTGDWKNHFSPEMNQRIDEWIEKNLNGCADLKFVTQLEFQD